MSTQDTLEHKLRAKVNWILDTRHTVPEGTKASEVYTERILRLVNSEVRKALEQAHRVNGRNDFDNETDVYIDEMLEAREDRDE